jgi:hypothetical protein
MRKRLGAFLMTLVISGMPVAFAVCQLSCVEPAMGRAADALHDAHAHHHAAVVQGTSSTGDSIAADSDDCNHVDGSVVLSPSLLKPPPATIATIGALPLSLETKQFSVTAIEHSPPGSVLRLVPLRI